MNTETVTIFQKYTRFLTEEAYKICRWSWVGVDTNSVTQYYMLSRIIQQVIKESRNGFTSVFHWSFLFLFVA